MRSLAFILVLIFALLHLLGFFKAYEFMRIDEISMAVSKPWGIVCLFCSMLLSLTAGFYYNRNRHWPILGIIAVTLSQTLVFVFWEDAMYGSFINAMLIEMICTEATGKAFWVIRQ